MHYRSHIRKCKAQSEAVEKRLADSIINLDIKRIKAINALKKWIDKYPTPSTQFCVKARCPTYEDVFAKQIIDLDLQLIAAKTKQFSLHSPAAHLFELHLPALQPPAPQPLVPQLFALQRLQINDMVEIITVCLLKFPNL